MSRWESMLYAYDRDMKNVKDRIKGLEQKENSETILKFLEKLFSEGLSKPRIIKYGNHMIVISKMIEKSFEMVKEEDIIKFLSQLEQSDYSQYTKIDYKVVLRRFFRFLGKGDLVKDIKTTLKRNKKKLPEELLTKDEVIKMIKAADHPRDKAIIAMLYEGGLRIGELASLKVKNVTFDEHGAIIKVRGKTGERMVRIVSSASLIAAWLEMHKRRDDKEAPLWVNLSTNYKKEGITYQAVKQNLKRIAEKAGIKKNITPHLFRHSRATHLARDLTEAEMNEYFGWVQGSDMPATYVHLSGRDVDDKILQIYNLKPKDRDREDAMRPKECPRCQYINAPVSRYCGRCGTVLNEGERVKLEVQGKEVTKQFFDLTSTDPTLTGTINKVMELVELLEGNPELFKKIRTMIKEE